MSPCAQLTVSEFIEQCQSGYLTDDDGYGQLVGVYSGSVYLNVLPSHDPEIIQKWDQKPGSFRIHWYQSKTHPRTRQ